MRISSANTPLNPSNVNSTAPTNGTSSSEGGISSLLSRITASAFSPKRAIYAEPTSLRTNTDSVSSAQVRSYGSIQDSTQQ